MEILSMLYTNKHTLVHANNPSPIILAMNVLIIIFPPIFLSQIEFVGDDS